MDPVSTSGINGTAVGVVDKYIVTNRGQSSRRGGMDEVKDLRAWKEGRHAEEPEGLREGTCGMGLRDPDGIKARLVHS